MAYTVERNPRGDGYVVRGDDGDLVLGSDGNPAVYGSEREAADYVDRQAAWEAEERDRAAGGDGGQLAEATDQVAARRASSSDPDDQRDRMDRGESRSGGYYDPYADDSDGSASSFDEGSADIPIWGWLSGAQARRDSARAQSEADRIASGWDALSDFMPTPDDLAVDYAHDPGVEAGWTPERAEADAGAIDAQRSALAGLDDIYSSGGITDADRARMQLGEMEVGRQMRASREADLAALQARGMGGSGAEMASMLSAQQSGADGLFARDAEIQSRAQDRAMDALSGMGSLGGQMRGQSFDESAWNAQQGNDYNRWNTDYDRERSRWNTQQTNRSRESMRDARQTSYENHERQQAGRTGQWSQASSGARQDQRRQDEANATSTGTVVGLLEEIL
jgi:hypothetical protein